ncbi:non-specific lipid transfer protein GPI-anchored 11-like [Aristolochia californica]|uniref:non-specific lipid transfer protein GPI-anchored 11-like n=1 Tax=Aristolochia californica TaxID=171875 RepID=UPI0035DA6FA5
MAKSLCVFLLLAALVSTVHSDPPKSSAQSPTPDPSFPACMTQDLTPLMACVNFVEEGSNVSKPDADCCKSYGEILKDNKAVPCLCEALKHPGASPIPLNFTRLHSLPPLCNIPNPPCGNGPSPSPSPVPPSPPNNSPPSPPSVPTPVPATPTTPPPAGSGSSGASSLSISAAFLAVIAASIAALF